MTTRRADAVLPAPPGLWRELAPPSTGLRTSVVIPVNNEAAGLAHTLAALAAQRGPDGPFDPRHFEVLVLANNCDDDSAGVVRRFARQHPELALFVAEVTLASDCANVGHARRLLMDEASRRLGVAGAGPHGVIASTDGDTVVAPDWLVNTLREIDAGAVAVGGRILTAPDEATDAATARWQRWDALYRLAVTKLESLLDPDPADPWPRHHQHFGASLAVSRAAYERVGGLPRVPYLEDEALVAALRGQDLPVRHSPHVRVTTSGRQEGRVEVGLSWQLREWARERQATPEPMVDDADEVHRQARARRSLRLLWQRRSATVTEASFQGLARQWGLSAAWLAARTAEAPFFGALWAEIERLLQNDRRPQAPVRVAIRDLRELIDAQSGAAPRRANTSSR